MSSLPAQGCLDTPGGKELTPLALRLTAAGIILVVSLIASSFPSLSKRAPSIEPPWVVFFIGKHFGTGVILSTAFVHLLQEGFESLTNPCLTGNWKNWAGLIVLSSFMAIFLVEYISTIYVERISKNDSAEKHDHHAEPFTPYRDNPDDAEVALDAQPRESVPGSPSEQGYDAQDSTGPRTARKHSRHSSTLGHHRHESPSSHHHKPGPRLSSRRHVASIFLQVQEAEEVSRIVNAPSHTHIRDPHSNVCEVSEGEVSRRTRIIGILVLQLGIMLHSVAIGLTLAITAGSDFSTLLTAVIFHQLFEGLSLGIRISTLPSGSHATRVLPAVLCILFATAAPGGLLIGIGVLPSATQSQLDASSAAQRALLTKGLMCAVSAGMLIYAAAVEMLAGDFVMDPEMRQYGLGKQVLALGSLILGVIAMAVVGIWS